MDAILLKTLPVRDPATLVVLTSYSKNNKVGDFGYPDYLAIGDAKPSPVSWQPRRWPLLLPELAPAQKRFKAKLPPAIFQSSRFNPFPDEHSGTEKTPGNSR